MGTQFAQPVHSQDSQVSLKLSQEYPRVEDETSSKDVKSPNRCPTPPLSLETMFTQRSTEPNQSYGDLDAATLGADEPANDTKGDEGAGVETSTKICARKSLSPSQAAVTHPSSQRS